jgi:hypothetical protein
MLTYSWDPDMPSRSQLRQGQKNPTQSFDLGPHPADPHSTILPAAMKLSESNGSRMDGPNAQKIRQEAQEIFVYGGDGGYVITSFPPSTRFHSICRTFTFWRFFIHVPLAPHEMAITYSINRGQQLRFFVPGRTQNMRFASTSVCLTVGQPGLSNFATVQWILCGS